MQYAIINDGVIDAVSDASDGFGNLSSQAVAVPSGSQPGGLWDGDDYTALELTTNQVNTERHRRQMLPVTVKVSANLPEEKIFPVDMAGGGKDNIGHLALMAVIKNGAGITTDFNFRDANNDDQTLTNNEVIEMSMQAAYTYSYIFEKSLVLKALKDDPDEVIPSNYEDDSHWT